MAIWRVEELDVYQKAFLLGLKIHHESLLWPKIEQYEMARQIRRASKSICANLAEGYVKNGSSGAEFKRYIQIALGSAEECRTWLEFASQLGYIDKAKADAYRDDFQEIIKMLFGLHRNWK